MIGTVLETKLVMVGDTLVERKLVEGRQLVETRKKSFAGSSTTRRGKTRECWAAGSREMG